MPSPLYLVDAFTDHRFAGNPAGVCLLEGPADEAWMQSLAAELNQPATAFAAPSAEGWSLRWFTATRELTLCGHGTLAASHVLFHEVGAETDVLRYDTVAGRLTARSVGEGLIELDFPSRPPAAVTADVPALAAALFPAGDAPALEAWRGGDDLLAVVPGAADVVGLDPDAAALAGIAARAIIVSAPAAADSGADVVSRVFCPSVGVLEDQVTGSAHCLVGPYWSARLGRNPLRARQVSARGGELVVDVRGDRVALAGRAVTVMRGQLP